MAKEWDRLAGEEGQKVETGRFGRALKLGKVAARLGGSLVKATLSRNREDTDLMAVAAMKQATRIVDVMSEMKGAAMKIGQMISTDPDLVTPEFADQLAKLQNKSTPMDYVTVSAQIESQLDRPIESIFSFFDPEPLGSASIGQVHRATLSDGRDVAVKVQYPGIRDSLDSDLKNLGGLMKMGRVFMSKERADEFLTEVRESLLGETDYLQEATNLARFHELLADVDGVVVPEPILELTTEQVLVMTFLEGEKLDDALLAMPDIAERSVILTRFVELYVKMLHELHVLHADPHPGNFLLTPDGDIALLDFGCIRDFDPYLTDGILRMLRAFWANDMARLSDLLQAHGFKRGSDNSKFPSHQMLYEYFNIIFEPLVSEEPFNFSQWEMHLRARNFLFKNMDMARTMPPAELLMYFRVLAGVKGLLTRVSAEIPVRQIATACCERLGIE